MASGHEMAMGLRAAYWSMHRQTNAHLAPLGATAEQFVVLALLAAEDGITQQELGRRATSDPNTIRAILVLLEKRGLVSRRRHPTDGRARCVTLTRKGKQAYEKWQAHIEPVQDRLLSVVPNDEADDLVGYLHDISEAMAERNTRAGADRSVTSDRSVDS